MATKCCSNLELALFFEVIPQISRSDGPIWMTTQIWIYRCLWNDTCSFQKYERGALLFFDIIRQISRSFGPKNRWFWSDLSKVIRPVPAIESLKYVFLMWNRLYTIITRVTKQWWRNPLSTLPDNTAMVSYYGFNSSWLSDTMWRLRNVSEKITDIKIASRPIPQGPMS